MFSKEKFFEQINNSVNLDWDHKDAVQLGGMLQHDTLVRALAHLEAEMRGLLNRWAVLDLTRQEMVAEAIKLQGKREGLLRAVELLAELAEGDEDGEG